MSLPPPGGCQRDQDAAAMAILPASLGRLRSSHVLLVDCLLGDIRYQLQRIRGLQTDTCGR